MTEATTTLTRAAPAFAEYNTYQTPQRDYYQDSVDRQRQQYDQQQERDFRAQQQRQLLQGLEQQNRQQQQRQYYRGY